MDVGQPTSAVETCVSYTCRFIGWLWNTLTILPWYITSGNYKMKRTGAIQARTVSGHPEGPYERVVDEHNAGLIDEDKETLDALFRTAAERNKWKNCFGTRELIKEEDEVQPNGRVFKKVILGNYNWITYNEALLTISKLSAGLNALGIECREKVIIFADTKAEWMISAQACFQRNFPLVTIYATLGDEALVYGFNEVEGRYVFTDAALLPKLKKLCTQMPNLTTIIYFGDAKQSLRDEFPENVKVYALGEIVDLGSKTRHLEVPIEEPPTGDDVAVIMYTSGSTGVPKGVLITHRNMSSMMKSAVSTVEMNVEDRYIGYLPLAHIMELMCENACLACGVPVGYSSPLTLSDQSSKIKRGSKGDVSVLKPTFMVAVPMIMERMRTAVMDKIKKGTRTGQLLFHFAYHYKLNLLKKGYDTPLLNKFIFSKVRGVLGGNIRLVLSGGAPLSPETEEFMNVTFCCPVGQGYGLTETCAAATIKNNWDRSVGHVGAPFSCCNIKLSTWDEGGYTVNDRPHPRGEILISGSSVSLGYFKQPEKTAESFVKDTSGKVWFHTGDIGEIRTDGTLKVIDRKKDLVKLMHGEYISLAKVEGVMCQSKYIDNCCVYGDSKEVYVVLLIVPHPHNLQELGREVGVEGQLEELATNKLVMDALMKDVKKVAAEGKLNKAEVPQKLKICAEPWTPESELVTSVLKLKRKNIQTFYQSDIERMYLN
jgi:long-chain acyl-CoA synthetase